MISDGFDGFWGHLAHHDVMLWAVSRAPLEKIDAHRRKTGWTFPWGSSFESDFNYDFFVGFSDSQQDEGYRYNFQDKEPLPAEMPADPDSHAGMCGVDWRTFLKDMPGMSAFVLEDGEVYHTYSTYGRASTSCGAPTSGSTEPRSAATSPAGHGGSGGTNMERFDGA
jgi:predicted dithiol-disulfide oxidoreductase (DUF899 family)